MFYDRQDVDRFIADYGCTSLGTPSVSMHAACIQTHMMFYNIFDYPYLTTFV